MYENVMIKPFTTYNWIYANTKEKKLTGKEDTSQCKDIFKYTAKNGQGDDSFM
jgi:hypothetical protein